MIQKQTIIMIMIMIMIIMNIAQSDGAEQLSTNTVTMMADT